jgi:hypothetical protein
MNKELIKSKSLPLIKKDLEGLRTVPQEFKIVKKKMEIATEENKHV